MAFANVLRRKEQAEPVKTSVTLPEELVEKLRSMSAQSGSSMSDVVRKAIHTEELLRKTRQRGGRVLIQGKDESVREVVFRKLHG